MGVVPNGVRAFELKIAEIILLLKILDLSGPRDGEAANFKLIVNEGSNFGLFIGAGDDFKVEPGWSQLFQVARVREKLKHFVQRLINQLVVVKTVAGFSFALLG